MSIGSKAVLSARTGVTANLPGDEVYAGKPALPIREEMKLQALSRRLPKLVARVKALEEAVQEESRRS